MNNPHPAERKHRVVVLVNPTLHCRATCAKLIQEGVNVVGIVECSTKTAGLPLSKFLRSCKRDGLWKTVSQTLSRLYYLLLNRSADNAIYHRLFPQQQIRSTLQDWGGPIITTQSYSASETREAIAALSPDILVVHSQSWVGKSVRELAGVKYVIGGHPGITPFYRGSHSSFWALLNGDTKNIGWTVFHVDRGVDTGDVICQGHVEPEHGDSYFTLNWRCMKEIAATQAAEICSLDQTGHIERKPHIQIPEGSEYGLPTLGDYLRYRRLQKQVR